MAISPTFTGFHKNPTSGRLEIYFNGALVAQANATDFGAVGTVASTSLTSTTTITAGTSILASTSIEATTTVTAGTGWTTTTGNFVNSAGDHRVTAGNVRLGAVSAFAMTEPTSAYVMKVGTAPAGAITQSGAIFTDGTTVKKIIADSTITDIES